MPPRGTAGSNAPQGAVRPEVLFRFLSWFRINTAEKTVLDAWLFLENRETPPVPAQRLSRSISTRSAHHSGTRDGDGPAWLPRELISWSWSRYITRLWLKTEVVLRTGLYISPQSEHVNRWTEGFRIRAAKRHPARLLPYSCTKAAAYAACR